MLCLLQSVKSLDLSRDFLVVKISLAKDADRDDRLGSNLLIRSPIALIVSPPFLLSSAMDLSLLAATSNPFTGRVAAAAGSSARADDVEADCQAALFPRGFDIPTSIKVRCTDTQVATADGEGRRRGERGVWGEGGCTVGAVVCSLSAGAIVSDSPVAAFASAVRLPLCLPRRTAWCRRLTSPL